MALSVAPILTRGMGLNPLLITRGFGTAEPVPPAKPGRRKSKAGSKDIDEYIFTDEYTVNVSLISINGEYLPKPISAKRKYVISNKPMYIKVSAEEIIYRKPKMYKILISEIKVKKGDY